MLSDASCRACERGQPLLQISDSPAPLWLVDSSYLVADQGYKGGEEREGLDTGPEQEISVAGGFGPIDAIWGRSFISRPRPDHRQS